jgi:hypothetical protein
MRVLHLADMIRCISFTFAFGPLSRRYMDALQDGGWICVIDFFSERDQLLMIFF